MKQTVTGTLVSHIDNMIDYAKRTASQSAVLFMDIDHFRKINSAYDHEIGDQVLAVVRERLRSVLKDSDLFVSAGGDDFVILLHSIGSRSSIVKMTKTILNKIAEPYLLDKVRCYLTASIGVCIYPEDGIDSVTLLKGANIAMYEAKKLGGNTYLFLKSSKTRMFTKKIEIEHALHSAHEQDHFVLHYQPIFNLRTLKPVRVEVLLRLQNANKTLSYPDEFLPIAEEYNLMVKINQWVIHHALLHAKKLKAIGLPSIPMSINIAESALVDIVPYLKQTMAKYSIDPTQVYIELTENSILVKTPTISGMLHDLHVMGVQISIDDFGKEYASLRYIKEFIIDNLKIDKLFVSDLPKDRYSVAILSGVIAMASALNISVTAEGIETEEQYKFLNKIGCTEGQGYYLSYPLSEKQLIDFLKKM